LDSDRGSPRDHGRGLQGFPRHSPSHLARWIGHGGKSGGLIMRVVLLGIVALLWVRSGETSLATVILVCIGSGSVSVVVSLWLLYGKVSSLGPSAGTQDEEEPVSSKEVLD